MEFLIVCLHGFLGTPSDFDFLKSDFEVFAPHLDDLVHLSPLELQDDILSKIKTKGNILIGYSFGARIAMGLFLRSPERFDRLILLAGHAGLCDEKQRQERKSLELNICKAISENNFDDFLNSWNNMELFKHDLVIAPEKKTPEVLTSYFKNFSLSVQPYYLNQLAEYRNKIVWLFGAEDNKYVTYAKENLAGFNIRYIPSCGHRVVHNLDGQNLIKKEALNA